MRNEMRKRCPCKRHTQIFPLRTIRWPSFSGKVLLSNHSLAIRSMDHTLLLNVALEWTHWCGPRAIRMSFAQKGNER